MQSPMAVALASTATPAELERNERGPNNLSEYRQPPRQAGSIDGDEGMMQSVSRRCAARRSLLKRRDRIVL
jgi:hypothetical protein